MATRDSMTVTVAVPKGRILKHLSRLLAAVGVAPDTLLADDRRLVRHDEAAGVRFLLLKPDDVPTYVEYGAADLGIVGRDVLMERAYDLYAPVDLGIGRCAMMVAGTPGSEALIQGTPPRTLRVATKFPHIAKTHFARRGLPVEIIFVQGSVELAPITGLADLIVDLVESGETLRQNGLVTIEHILDVSSVVVANRSALKLKREAISPFLAALDPAGPRAVHGAQDEDRTAPAEGQAGRASVGSKAARGRGTTAESGANPGTPRRQRSGARPGPAAQS
jgi:ATP phosphoribosyltransferase